MVKADLGEILQSQDYASQATMGAVSPGTCRIDHGCAIHAKARLERDDRLLGSVVAAKDGGGGVGARHVVRWKLEKMPCLPPG